MLKLGKGSKCSLNKIAAECNVILRIFLWEKVRNYFFFIFQSCSHRHSLDIEIFRKFCHFRAIFAI